MRDGNTREDGTACTPPCLYSRPADSSENYTNLAPNLGLLFRLDAENSAYLTLTRGFRAPQAAELYRLQAGQNVADLHSETIDSLELGWHHQSAHLDLSVATFAMHKDHYILQDSNRYNVSDGESRHVGAELDAEARRDNGLYAGIAATWIKQTYAFSQQIAGGETITSGNDIDTAPHAGQPAYRLVSQPVAGGNRMDTPGQLIPDRAGKPATTVTISSTCAPPGRSGMARHGAHQQSQRYALRRSRRLRLRRISLLPGHDRELFLNSATSAEGTQDLNLHAACTPTAYKACVHAQPDQSPRFSTT
jgi:outer membrane receptor protein involved in Fe transport